MSDTHFHVSTQSTDPFSSDSAPCLFWDGSFALGVIKQKCACLRKMCNQVQKLILSELEYVGSGRATPSFWDSEFAHVYKGDLQTH